MYDEVPLAPSHEASMCTRQRKSKSQIPSNREHRTKTKPVLPAEPTVLLSWDLRYNPCNHTGSKGLTLDKMFFGDIVLNKS